MSMSTKFISYDLLKEGQNYDDLYAFLKGFPVHHRITESFWMVNTSLSSEKLRDEIAKHLDSNDRLFIVNYANGSSSAWRNGKETFKDDLIHES
ncbi:hypothetical protein OQI89_14045 [Lentilactobacillus diolivorans]|uniref:hypothetical protein n=1 Tax=Lentilactobacillus diolivorans TaxID=179838 RepID=UPI0024695D50|nr:hypothetical protein [Lentilactobacillus diolivorans]MDH5106956.1 hypothetical protein [Lentilactobacillus diolivorans]